MLLLIVDVFPSWRFICEEAATCCIWLPSTLDEGDSKDDSEEKDIDLALPKPKLLVINLSNENNILPTTERLVLSVYSEQNVHQLPILLLKRLLLGFLKRRNELWQQQRLDSEMILTISSARPYTPLQLYVSSSELKHHVRVIFDTLKPVEEVEDTILCSLHLCARCGVSAGCNCGWRQNHIVWPQQEHLSVLDFIASSLPQLPTKTSACFHLCLGERQTVSVANFAVQILDHKLQQPLVESPYTEFKIELHLSDLTWRIARRYREFVELHTRLKVIVQEDKLPQLPPTKWFAVTDRIFLLHRQRQLENYIKGIFMIEELQDAVPFLAFLGVLSTAYVDHVALRRNRRQLLHLQVLEFYTQPADLILFNGRAKASGFQRSMTRSEWDHVAVVVPPREGGSLQLLEATGDGVTLTPLTARLLAYSTFHVRYLILRKLHTPLLSRAVVNDLLERFTNEVEGLPYGLSFRRILHARQAEQRRSRDSTFFCSELVAEAFQALGIIPGSSESNDFWPGSFSPGGFVDAELARHGAYLSPEIIIDCKLLEVATATKRSLNY